MNQGIRRILVAAFIITTAAVTGVTFFAFSSKNAIGFGQQCSGSFCWGYRLDQARFVPKTSLTFWSASGLKLQYELPTGVIVPVNPDRWLGNGRAIYLNFRVKPSASSKEPGEHIRIVYDFQRGSLYVASELPLWRNGDPRSPAAGHNWLTDDQFDAILIQIDPTM